MPNYDMSEQACRERVEAARRLDKFDIAIKILADTCEELLMRVQRLEENSKCSKQE